MKKTTLFLAIYIILISLISCLGKENKPKRLIDMFQMDKSITHTEIQTDFFNMPIDIQYYDNKLIVLDYDGETYINIYDLSQNKKSLGFLSKGQGPNEATDAPTSIFMINDTTMIWYDADRSIRQAIVSNKMDKLIRIDKKCELYRSKPILRIVPIYPNKYVGVGLFEKGRYGLFDSIGNTIKYKYDYPNDNMNCNPITKAIANQGGFLTNSLFTKFVFFGFSSEIIEFFKVKGLNDFQKTKEIHFNYAKYNCKETIPIMEKEYHSIKDGCSSDRYIYFLFSEDNMDIMNNEGNIILVFDWNGNPIMKYHLDLKVSAITIDKKDKFIYAIADNPEGTLVSFKLK